MIVRKITDDITSWVNINEEFFLEQ